MYAYLGKIKFEGLKSFTSFSRERETVYAEINQIGTKPEIQKTGEKLTKVPIEARFHFEFCDPETEIKALNDLRLSGDVLPLILGNGENYGNFVIASLKETYIKSGPTGNIIDATVEIGLIEHARATVAADLTKAVDDGFASDIAKVVPQKIVTQTPGIAYQAAQSNALVLQKSSDTDKDVASAKLNETKRPGLFAKINTATTEIQAAANDAANKIRQIETQVNGADRIIQDCEDMARFASDLAVAIDTADIDLVDNANGTMQTAAAALGVSNSKLLQLIAGREI